MTWLDFTAATVVGLAWPLVALVALLVFREPIGDLLARLKKARYGDFELAFELGLDSATAAADAAQLPSVLDVRRVSAASKVPSDAVPNWSVAVLSKWRDVETALAEHFGTSQTGLTAAELYQAASEGRLSIGLAAVVVKLMELRHQAAHPDGSVSPIAAQGYERLADRVLKAVTE